jgi:hypothetical protein
MIHRSLDLLGAGRVGEGIGGGRRLDHQHQAEGKQAAKARAETDRLHHRHSMRLVMRRISRGVCMAPD